jgi:small subunit ribosomal protein S6
VDRATPPDGERRKPGRKERALRELAQDSRPYEMMVVVAPTVGDEGLPAVVERVSGYVAAQDGTVTSVKHDNPWGRRRLAYPIEDHRDAFYVLYMFDADPRRITSLERDLKLDEQVIRHLVVRYDPMTEHEERTPRGREGEPARDGRDSGPRRASPPPAADEQPAEAQAE